MHNEQMQSEMFASRRLAVGYASVWSELVGYALVWPDCWSVIHQCDLTWSVVHQCDLSWSVMHQYDLTWSIVHQCDLTVGRLYISVTCVRRLCISVTWLCRLCISVTWLFMLVCESSASYFPDRSVKDDPRNLYRVAPNRLQCESILSEAEKIVHDFDDAEDPTGAEIIDQESFLFSKENFSLPSCI